MQKAATMLPLLLATQAYAGNWTYVDTQNAMGDEPSVIACTTSLNEVHLEWPYHDSKAELCVRYRPRPNVKEYRRYDVIFRLLGQGQILCSTIRCPIRVRWDAKKAASWDGAQAADDSSNVVFIDPMMAWAFAYATKWSKRLAFEATFFQAGTQILTFNPNYVVDTTEYHPYISVIGDGIWAKTPFQPSTSTMRKPLASGLRTPAGPMARIALPAAP